MRMKSTRRTETDNTAHKGHLIIIQGKKTIIIMRYMIIMEPNRIIKNIWSHFASVRISYFFVSKCSYCYVPRPAPSPAFLLSSSSMKMECRHKFSNYSREIVKHVVSWCTNTRFAYAECISCAIAWVKTAFWRQLSLLLHGKWIHHTISPLLLRVYVHIFFKHCNTAYSLSPYKVAFISVVTQICVCVCVLRRWGDELIENVRIKRQTWGDSLLW